MESCRKALGRKFDVKRARVPVCLMCCLLFSSDFDLCLTTKVDGRQEANPANIMVGPTRFPSINLNVLRRTINGSKVACRGQYLWEIR
jgi:hypothetical protein